jgi:hypothetical protein
MVFYWKNFWRRKKSPAVPMLRMEISPKYEPAWEERITQTITKRSISPIGPGQTLRSNALAKNNRNNYVPDSTAITVYRGPAFAIQTVYYLADFPLSILFWHFFILEYCDIFMPDCSITKYPCPHTVKRFSKFYVVKTIVPF